MRTLSLVLLLAAGSPATARAGLNFGLGKAASKRSMSAMNMASERRAVTGVSNNAVVDPAPPSDVNHRLKWAYVGDPVYYSSPAVAADGTVYFGTSETFVYYHGYWSQGQKPPANAYGLYAYNPDGTRKWKYMDGSDTGARGAPVIGPDGTVYIVLERLGTSQATTYEELHAVNTDGTQKWKVTVSTYYAEIGTLAPAVAPDGTIYIAGQNFTAFNPDGSLKWRLTTSPSPTSIYFGSPAIGSDGAVYTVYWSSYGTYGQTVRAINPDGTVRWTSRDLGNAAATSSLALAADGTVYLGLHDEAGLSEYPGGALIAFSSTGAIRWAFAAYESDVRSSPAIAADGTIYFGTKGNNGYVYAVNPDGTQKWRYATWDDALCPCGVDVYTSPAIGADGTIYTANEFGYMYAFRPDGTLLWKDNTILAANGGSNWSSPAIVADGTLYIGKSYGAFMAIRTDSLGLSATAQWPKFHYSLDNASRRP